MLPGVVGLRSVVLPEAAVVADVVAVGVVAAVGVLPLAVVGAA